MPTAADVLRFPSGHRRTAKASLPTETDAGVRRIQALAPELGHANPESVPRVESIMRNLIDNPPTGGLERDQATAANGQRRRRKALPRPVSAVFERVGLPVQQVLSCLAVLEEDTAVTQQLVQRYGRKKHSA